jgi:hypothetical protein
MALIANSSDLESGSRMALRAEDRVCLDVSNSSGVGSIIHPLAQLRVVSLAQVDMKNFV